MPELCQNSCQTSALYRSCSPEEGEKNMTCSVKFDQGEQIGACRRRWPPRPAFVWFSEMLLTEYRMLLPMTLSDYRVGQLYTTARQSAEHTSSGDGVRVLANEPFERDGRSGQFTRKIIYVASKLPAVFRKILPAGALQ